MDTKDNNLIPELELNITPTENNDFKVELMHEGFIEYLKKESLLTTELDAGIIFIKIRELPAFVEHLRKMYITYKGK